MKYNADKRWREIRDTPDESFTQIAAGEVLQRATSWDLPEEVSKVVRVFDAENCTVTELCFSDVKKAKAFIEQEQMSDREVTYYNAYEMFSTLDQYASAED